MQMIRKVLLAVIALAPTLVYAGVIDFVSGTDDRCRLQAAGGPNMGSCGGVTSNAWPTWISEAAFNAAAGSTGAEWIQAQGSFNMSNINDYRIFELDLNRTGQDMTITSLWVSADDYVSIRTGGVEIWNSQTAGYVNLWTQAVDVIAEVGEFLVGGNNRLNFYVHDIGNQNQGPTGLIFAGTATMVPEPGTLGLFALGLLGLAVARRSAR